MRITWLMAFLLGCGSDGGSSLEAIYSVGTWTRNATTCDAEGASVVTSRKMFFYIKYENFLGTSFLNVNSCDDVAMCKMEANDDDTLHIGDFIFEEGGDSNGWSSRNAFAFEIQGQCEGGVTESKLTGMKGGMVRIEQRHFEAVPFPANVGAEDECPDAKVEQAAAGQPCTELEVVTATFNTNF